MLCFVNGAAFKAAMPFQLQACAQKHVALGLAAVMSSKTSQRACGAHTQHGAMLVLATNQLPFILAGKAPITLHADDA
jgi:hypothetical protein